MNLPPGTRTWQAEADASKLRIKEKRAENKKPGSLDPGLG